MREHHGSCHCGQIRLILRETPVDAGECNCSICLRIGSLWHNCPREAVEVDGNGISYQQGDCMLDLWHCPTCGCTTHWTPTDSAYPSMSVNLRMFDPVLWRELPRRLIDGASY
ncbi:MAG TPA: GFA family protein [Sphingomicrobium sp.]|jgi:hypothetical protein